MSTEQKIDFHEPGEDEPAGYHVYKRQKSPYERYMDEEGIPIFRGIGTSDTRSLTLGDWQRRGGRPDASGLHRLDRARGPVPAAGGHQGGV